GALGQTDYVRLDPPVLDGQQVPSPSHSRLDLVRDQQDAVLRCQLPEPGKEIVGRNEVAAFALDRFDEDCGDALRRGYGGEKLFDALDRLIRGHAASRRRERGVEHLRQKGRETAALARLRGGQ